MPEDDAPVGQPEAIPPVSDEAEKLRRKNAELLEEKRKLKERLATIPDGVDVQALLQFKADHDRQKLESAGEYEKAREQLQAQYDSDTGTLKARIAELEAKVRELELISPAASELAKVVHDPDDVFKTGRLKPEQIERDASGPVVVNGLERIPVADWAKANLPQHYLRVPPARGSGAPAGGGSSRPVGSDDADLRFFLPGTMNLTEQARIFKVDPDRYEALKAAASKR